MKNLLFLLLILILAAFLRFYQLDLVPTGLHGDAASQGYNAFSILHTLKDRYGETLPILFRSLGSYQPPLYTYLTIIPVSIFGNNQFSVHFISALSGTLLVLFTYIFITTFKQVKNRHRLALIAALIVAISPWSVMFGRMAVEASLAVTLFSLSMILFSLSLTNAKYFPLASLMLGISTHAYYSERIISIMFLPMFIFLFKEQLLKYKKFLLSGLLLFILTQIPHWLILQTGAFSRRFDQVSYFNSQNLIEAGIFKRVMIIFNNFLKVYSTYFSLPNLFSDLNPGLGRLIPGFGAFFAWAIIPCVFGLRYLIKNFSSDFVKIIILLFLTTPIPAGLTGDVFYPLRALNLLWVISLIISLGIYLIFDFLKSRVIIFSLLTISILFSLFSLYVSYFVISKYISSNSFGYSYMKLMDELPKYENKQIVIDSSRDPGVGVRLAFLKKYKPAKLQKQLKHQMQTPYYHSFVNSNETYIIDNITVKPLDYKDTCKPNLILIGDLLSISQDQQEEHSLLLEFEVNDPAGNIFLRGYSTHPIEPCI